MDWTEYRALLANALVITDPGGLNLLDTQLPQIVAHAEELIYKDSDFDFLATRTIDATSHTFAGDRNVEIPTDIVIIEQVALIIPSSRYPDELGSERVALQRVGPAFLDMIWPFTRRMRRPKPFETYFAVFSQQVTEGNTGQTTGNLKIAPTVDGEYVAEIRGTFDPRPASADNPRTFLLTYFPSLFFSASMLIATGVLKQNFGAQADDARQAISWQQQYMEQKQVAVKRAQRQRSWGPGWVPFGPAPMGPMPRFGVVAQPHPQAGAPPGAPG